MKRLILLFSLLIILKIDTINASIETQTINPINSNSKKFTIIFVHGTYGIDYTTLFQIIFYNIFSKNKLKKIFTKIKAIRFNKNLSEHEGICSNKKGLDPISTHQSHHNAYAYVNQVLKTKFSKSLKTDDINYYAFNWHGCLSEELRNNETSDLYKELEELKKNDPEREIIIIAFSHGGNIALSLQKIAIEKKSKFKIDLLILLATPIGKISEQNARSNFFSKIINFYSLHDYYQISDFLFNFPKTHRTLCNDKKIINIDLRFFKKKNNKMQVIFPNHKYFGNINYKDNLPPFLTLLPDILQKIENILHHDKNNYIIGINLKNSDNNFEKTFKITIKNKK